MNAENWMRLGAALWLQSFVVLATGLLGARLLQRRGALPQMTALRATLLGVALCAIVSLITASRIPARWNVSMPPPSLTTTFIAPLVTPNRPATTKITPTKTQSVPESETTVSTERPVVSVAPVVEEQTSALTTWAGVYQGVAYFWLFGSALWISWLSLCALRLARVRRSSTRIMSGEWHDDLKSLCDVHGWRRPQLLQSGEVRSPLLMGLWRPALVLPREDVFDNAARRAVLLHEMTHFRHRDLRWMYATKLLCAILWPQPLLWVLSRHMERVAEDVCDEAVVRGGCAPRDYARCLLDLSERLTLHAGERALAAGVVPRQSSLGQRVRRILDEKRRGVAYVARPVRAFIGLATLGAIVVAVCAIGVSNRFDAQTIVAGPLSANVPWHDFAGEPRLPFRPQSQTINGVTIRVLDAEWKLPEWKQHESENVFNDFQKSLVVHYEVSGDNRKVRAAKGKQLLDYVTSITPQDLYGFPAGNGYGWSSGSIEMSGLDPRQSAMPFEFEFLDPAAPPRATGKFQETLVFKNVPLPPKRDQVLHIGRSLTTSHGTRVFLEAIAVSSAKSNKFIGEENKILMSAYSLPPAQTPDMTATLRFSDTNGIVGTKGEKVTGRWGNGWIGGDELGNLSNAATVMFDAVPSLKARSVNVRVEVSEEAPSLKQDKWFRRFRFQLPQNQLPVGAISSVRPLAVAESSDFSATLDFLRKFGDTHKTQICIANKEGANWDWNVETATLDNSVDTWQRGTTTSSVWKRSGRPARVGEKCVQLDFSFFIASGAKTPASKLLKMRLELQAHSQKPRVVNFRNLPVVRRGQSLSLNRTVTFPSGAWFTIRKVENVASVGSNGSNGGTKDKSQTSRMTITYETNAEANLDHWITWKKSSGTDNLGHKLQTNGISQAGQTLFFVPPSLKSTSFDLRLLLSEETRGPRKVIVFNDLPEERARLRQPIKEAKP